MANFAAQGGQKMSHMHMTAPTQFLEAKGIRFAYRRFREETGVPLVFMQHFRGGLDHWDPAITDGLGRDRPVVLFDNAGVAGSSGDTPDTSQGMGEYATAFVRALDLAQIDLLGFSIGGYVAQAFTLQQPRLVRRLILHRAARRCAYARNNGVLSGSRQREPQSRKGSMARVVAPMKPPVSDETANVAHLQIRNFGTTKARSWALFDLR
jgi:pimeloyl-ACP methyl ester carboxylesterase